MWKQKALNKVLVIGSGPIVIGQAAEFDYAGTQACLSLKEEGITVVLVNNNPATIMTDEKIADSIYMEPLQVDTLEKIIAKEKPDGLIGCLGGQTGLNLTVELSEKGILDKYKVKLLGTSVSSIKKGEDRELFRNLMIEINEPIPESKIVESMDEGIDFIKDVGFPVILRPAYTLGGTGGGFAYNEDEFIGILNQGLKLSPIHQVLVEKSIKGWKEVEYEVMRDSAGNCMVVCDMENMDPVGVHTGDSIVAAPAQTLSEFQKQMLKNASIKIIRALDVVGGCNIQFALHPEANEYFIIEVNPRVSRSSALASKATGYPIAYITAKCAVGKQLDEIQHPVQISTNAYTEPILDYVVVKLPRFPFDKFTEGDRTLGTQMKATGEVMAIDSTFEGALNKAVRSLEMNVTSLNWPGMHDKSLVELVDLLSTPNDLRLFAITEAFHRKMNIDQLIKLTDMTEWFLGKIKSIIVCEQLLVKDKWPNLSMKNLKEAKRLNISDERIADLAGTTAKELRSFYRKHSMKPVYKAIGSGEFDDSSVCYYSTWQGSDHAVQTSNKKKVLVLGSGPIRIGQGVEFDYCSVHAALSLKKMGYEAVVINNNPETVSTDYSVADRLYFEPLALEDIMAVIEKENIDAVLIQFGGQTAINLANDLKEEGINVLGTTPEHIDQMEDREQFYNLLNKLNIPHIEGHIVRKSEELTESVQNLGFPVLIRPSYVIGGQSMFICNNEQEMNSYMERMKKETNGRIWPLLVDQYVPGLECEIDVISDGNEIVIPGIFEHLEKAGVHSGDSMTIFPSVSLPEETKMRIVEIAEKISSAVPVIGMMNIQFVIFENIIYVLEVNPRSSRTVPIMSKVTGIPMIEWAVKAQLGTPLIEITEELGLLKEPVHFTVKAPIFSAGKLNGVDHVLGPEMKSTGEIIGLGWSKPEALANASSFLGIQNLHQEKLQLFVSVSDRMKKESIKLITEFMQLGVQITATEGTAKYLQKAGIQAEEIIKNKEGLLNHWKNTPPHIVLNIPNQGRQKEKIGFYIRELSVRYQVPYFTSLETLQAMTGWFKNKKFEAKPRTLREYLKQMDVEKNVKENFESAVL
ncbi:carbamoyl phosphate synthase large subunit [Virgibacillus indicus]|uniref:Carbamoyl phosphate synthase large subunit n=1 Tax=Virgibacillus indicus TaxID=2024554 RepID=A0A265N8R5_9BACI|nr:carbamoyl-phosphate synthase (glutamine-hydrolyzing) large subunit [Virgibacillus indicus]OZU87849.1 carbamoyl phosphate synthase large subunit [Virgibacillus indicus]